MTGIECALVARLGRDAELKMVKGGELPMVSFTAAVEEKVQTDEAPAVWVRVVTFGELAEQMAPRLIKGAKVYVEGRLEASIWQPEGGPPRLNLNITATTIQPLGQIGRQRPRAARGQRTWDRARDAGRAQQAGAAILRERGRLQEPPADWLEYGADR